jgi:cysteinyl-tRNA synthetase
LVLGTHYKNPIDFSRTREVEGEKCSTVRGTIDIAFDRLEYFYETLSRVDELLEGAEVSPDTPLLDDERVGGVIDGFVAAMDDDFNTARALAGIGETMRYVNELCDMKAKKIKKLEGGRPAWLVTIAKLAADLREVCGVLGLCEKPPAEALAELRDFAAHCLCLDRQIIEAKIAERAEARTNKDWARSDALRDELLEMGVEVRDTPSGTQWKVRR